jgi:hypothetical protein
MQIVEVHLQVQFWVGPTGILLASSDLQRHQWAAQISIRVPKCVRLLLWKTVVQILLKVQSIKPCERMHDNATLNQH